MPCLQLPFIRTMGRAGKSETDAKMFPKVKYSVDPLRQFSSYRKGRSCTARLAMAVRKLSEGLRLGDMKVLRLNLLRYEGQEE